MADDVSLSAGLGPQRIICPTEEMTECLCLGLCSVRHIGIVMPMRLC